MWIRLVFAKPDPGKVEEIRKLYNSQELTDFFEAQPGHRFHHLLESSADPNEVVFLTAWDSEAEMTAAFASEAHKTVGAKFKPFLVAPSERKVYEIHE